jgi:hypothetical protein
MVLRHCLYWLTVPRACTQFIQHWMLLYSCMFYAVRTTKLICFPIQLYWCIVSSDVLKWEALGQKKTRPCIARDGIMIVLTSCVFYPCSLHRVLKDFRWLKEMHMSALDNEPVLIVKSVKLTCYCTIKHCLNRKPMRVGNLSNRQKLWLVKVHHGIIGF